MSEFDDALRLKPDGPSAYAAELSDDWRIGGAINGGILLGLLGSALRETLGPGGHPDPLSLSAYYLSSSHGGPASVDTEVVRAGGTVSTAAATLCQDGVDRMRVLATYGDLGRLGGEVHATMPPPGMPPPQECVTLPPPESLDTAFLNRFELRFDPEAPSGDLAMQGWFRLADDREPDVLLLLMAVDVLPPVTFQLGRFGWAPTLELTAHVHAHPAPGWLRVRHESRHFVGGLLQEDSQVWDSTGRLVASGRQLARPPRQSN